MVVYLFLLYLLKYWNLYIFIKNLVIGNSWEQHMSRIMILVVVSMLLRSALKNLDENKDLREFFHTMLCNLWIRLLKEKALANVRVGLKEEDES